MSPLPLFSPPPRDWRAARPDPEPDGEPGGVDVVLPVYGAPRELALCLASLGRHTDFGRHRLVVAVDGPQPAEVEELLRRLPAGSAVLRQPARSGFVATANRGLRLALESDRDPLLLNSDTEVTPRWLEKMREAAYSSADVGTVTPFSNDASLASLPAPFEANALPAGWSLDAFAALVEGAAERSRTPLPTGVGFCLFLKRKVLRRTGLFDEGSFGLGYGEENDLCFRIAKAGYRNVLDDATFVFHAGGASFGAEGAVRRRAGRAALSRLHPDYLPTIARFQTEDPLRPARERILARLRAATPRLAPPPTGAGGSLRAPQRVVHLVHGWPPWSPAGTETYARRLAVRQAPLRRVAVYARRPAFGRPKGEALELWDEGVRVRLVANDFTQQDPLSRNALWDRGLDRDFGRFLDAERPDLLHVHHLAGHAFSLVAVAALRRIPIVYQIQDWWAPCARANLLDRELRLCSGPALGKCSACLPATGIPPRPLNNRALYALRALLSRWALGRADYLVMGSESIRSSYRELGFLPTGAPEAVLPYGIERPAGPLPRPPRPEGAPLRFGFLGSLLPHKGADLALRAFRGVAPERARLHLWGDLAAAAGQAPEYAAELRALATPAVTFEGNFEESRRGEVLGAIDVLLVPSRGLESFGLVAYEALAEGIPVLAAKRGALGEIFGALPPCGATFEPDDPRELAAWIERLAADPAIVARWSRGAPRVREMDEHAAEIEAVYRRVLGAAAQEP